jgi:hypothetical protein
MIQLYVSPPGSVLTWNKDQIYDGPDSAVGINSGGVVPKVGDLVTTWIGSGRYDERVTAVSSTHISTLEPT